MNRNKLLLALLFAAALNPLRSWAQTYKDVAPIFIANCTSCHHPGGIQFPLTKYSEVVPNGALIKANVQNLKMPPWPADPSYKHYVHERVVSATDKALLISWIDGGMVAGDTSLAPPIPVYGNAQLNGTPDLILSLPKFTSTSTTADKYICINVPVNLTQDRYVRAFEYIPGNAAIIHHAVITIDTTGTSVDDYSGNCTNFQGQINIGDYAPGMGPTVLPGVAPAKLGFRIKAGSNVSVQLHIPEGTAGQKDSSELRLFFYPIGETGIREMYFQTVLQNWNFYVPANDSITATAKYPTGTAGVPIDISLYSSFPHSHKTCTSIINFAYKNTDTIPLIRIPHWDFHWQGQYTFEKMVKFPQGYHLFSSHKYDNTINNPETPNPNAPVLPGLFTDDEMLFDSYLFTFYQAGDENIDIAALLANDPLFYPTSVSQTEPTIISPRVYPNPFTESVNLEYTLFTAQFVQVSVYNNLGQEVNKLAAEVQASGFHRYNWHGRDASGQKLPPGMYTYKIQAGNKKCSGQMILKSN
ncbi:hypothetical protein EMGBS15_10630 [Filimonas sp.]|nr:hypothetical protein EMGBS15_10630 [Filimonas sp.]